MSIVALKRNSKRFTRPISGIGRKGFALNGGHRNQGRVGQDLRGRTIVRTPFRGTVPMGNGACGTSNASRAIPRRKGPCDTYPINIVKGGSPCTNNPNIVKLSSMNTKGRIESGLIHPVGGEYRNSGCLANCRPIWAINLSPEEHSQGTRIDNLSRKTAGCVVRKLDAGAESCKPGCTSRSYFIGGQKFVSTPYAKDLNAYPISQSQYMQSVLFNTKNLPTPACKKHFPMNVNNNSCAAVINNPQEAIAKGLLPSDWNNCKPCANAGRPHQLSKHSQNIPINTVLKAYKQEQTEMLSGQEISNAK